MALKKRICVNKDYQQEHTPLSPAQITAIKLYRAQLNLSQQLKKQAECEEIKSFVGQKYTRRKGSDMGTVTENNTVFREVFGDVIRSLRIEKKKTLHDVAEMTGISLGYISEVERGKKEASSEVMETISLAFGLKLSDTLRIVATALDLNETDRKEFLKSGMFRR